MRTRAQERGDKIINKCMPGEISSREIVTAPMTRFNPPSYIETSMVIIVARGRSRFVYICIYINANENLGRGNSHPHAAGIYNIA